MAAESSRAWPGCSWVPWRLGRSLGCFERDGVESSKVNESGRGKIAQTCCNGEVQPSLRILACSWPTGCHHLQVLPFCSSWKANDNCEHSKPRSALLQIPALWWWAPGLQEGPIWSHMVPYGLIAAHGVHLLGQHEATWANGWKAIRKHREMVKGSRQSFGCPSQLIIYIDSSNNHGQEYPDQFKYDYAVSREDKNAAGQKMCLYSF